MSYSVWIYGPGIGWWLHEEGYDNLTDASAGLVDAIEHGPDAWTGGAVVPDGGFPMPMCMNCKTRPDVSKKPKRTAK
jgi:hypothetical protein